MDNEQSQQVIFTITHDFANNEQTINLSFEPAIITGTDWEELSRQEKIIQNIALEVADNVMTALSSRK